MKKTASAATLAVIAVAVGAEHFGFAQSENSVSTYQAAPNTEIRWVTLTDPNTGMWSEKLPYPSDWQLTGKAIVGPGDTRIQEVAGDVLSNQNRTIDQIINGKLLPMLKKENNRVLNVETYSVLAQKLKEHYSQYWSIAPTQKHYSVKGIEYEDDDGSKGLLIVYFVDSRSQFGNTNFYYIGIMESRASHYDTSKSAFLYAQANKRVNPENIAAFNRKEQQKAANSNRQFQARQTQKQRQFDSWMNTQRQVSNSALDSSMNSWRARNEMMDHGQELQVNSIYEQTQVVHPNTGESWTVDDGYNRYYLNNDHQYISTDDYFYNPNMDPNLNNQQWYEVSPYD